LEGLLADLDDGHAILSLSGGGTTGTGGTASGATTVAVASAGEGKEGQEGRREHGELHIGELFVI
jgi:hypothetical protein